MTRTTQKHYDMEYQLVEIGASIAGAHIATALLTWYDAGAEELYEELVPSCRGPQDALWRLANRCDEREDIIYRRYNMGAEEVKNVRLTVVWR